MKIISLVPSITELVCDLGYKDQVVGCTQFCVHPAGLHRTAELVGGTKDPDLEKIRSLEPSHIIVNTEENRAEDIQSLKNIANTLETFPKSPDEITSMIQDVSKFLGETKEADKLIKNIDMEFEKLTTLVNKKNIVSQNKFLYFIWVNPWMVAGENTYISKFLETLGLENAAPKNERYPHIQIEDIKKYNPDLLFLASEPWPFRKRDLETIKQFWPEHPLACRINGKLLSWYGSSTLKALEEMNEWVKGKPNKIVKPFDGNTQSIYLFNSK